MVVLGTFYSFSYAVAVNSVSYLSIPESLGDVVPSVQAPVGHILKSLNTLKVTEVVEEPKNDTPKTVSVFDVPFFDRSVEQWKKTLDVNLLGTFLCSKYVSQQMLKTNGGKIINISSTNGINSFSPAAMDYDSSKAGIIILTRDLAKELAPKIQVNSIAPGWVDTEMNKDLPKDFVEEETAKIYLKRFAKPEEIAKAILFLASDEASYITGSILKVDGGYG